MGKCGEVFGNAVQTGELKKCLRTGKFISVTCFDKNPKSGKPYCFCVVWKPKSEANEKNYLKTAAGKASRKKQNSRETIVAMKKAYRDSEVGKAKAKEYHSSEKFLEKCRVYSKSDKGKLVRQRTYKKNKLCHDLMNGLARILRGGDSPNTLKHINFGTSMDVRAHFRSKLAEVGEDVKMADFGTKWTVDHSIPKSKYDHENPADVLRCWSKSNMRPMDTQANREKSDKLLDDYVALVPDSARPLAWFEGI